MYFVVVIVEGIYTTYYTLWVLYKNLSGTNISDVLITILRKHSVAKIHLIKLET